MKTWLGSVFVLALAANASTMGLGDRENHFVLRTSAEAVASVCAKHDLELVRTLSSKLFLVSAPVWRPTADVLEEVKADPLVKGFEADGKASTPPAGHADRGKHFGALSLGMYDRRYVSYGEGTAWSSYVNQPAMAIIGMGSEKDVLKAGGPSSEKGVGITVAVIDTGVDPNHPALRGVLLPGYDFTRDVDGASEFPDLDQSTAALLDQSMAALLDRRQSTSALLDSVPAEVNQSTAALLDADTARQLSAITLPPAFGHGTMVAGLVHLVAPSAKILPLKAFNASGFSNTSDIVRAVYYAVSQGAKVINMSFSLENFSDEVMKAVNFATRSGVICVASVGNSHQETLVYPAALANVVSVASTSNEDILSDFSNYGTDLVKLSAPGEAVITTYPGGRYAAASGTSFSTPLVAGAAALIIEAKAGTNYYVAINALASAKPVAGGAGYGRLDVPSALKTAKAGLK